MKKRVIGGIDVESSSGNVFADLRLLDADTLKIKSCLVIEITQAIRKLGLTQQEAAKRMGITQPKVSVMMRGDFSKLSERELMDCLNQLGYDIDIKVKPASQPVPVFKRRGGLASGLNPSSNKSLLDAAKG
jgi:predicted XRE-type DNA-binding protein